MFGGLEARGNRYTHVVILREDINIGTDHAGLQLVLHKGLEVAKAVLLGERERERESRENKQAYYEPGRIIVESGD